MTKEMEVASNSLFLAKKYLIEGKPGRSYAHLLVVLKLMPVWKEEVKHLFFTSLSSWGTYLESKGRYSDLFDSYQQALEHYNQSELLYNNLGSHLYR